MSYQDEMYKDAKKNKWLKWPFIFFIFLVAGIFLYKIMFKPVKIGPVELNQDEVVRIHDTVPITKITHDTVTIIKPTTSLPHKPKTQIHSLPQSQPTTIINVESKDQKGGQTAAEITNNN